MRVVKDEKCVGAVDSDFDVNNFQQSAQRVLRDNMADWDEYKRWCSENKRQPHDIHAFCYYVETVLGKKVVK